MKLKGIAIKPGMLIETDIHTYIVFPGKDKGNSVVFHNISIGGIKKSLKEYNITKIIDAPIKGEIIYSEKILWDKDKQFIGMSVKEFTENFYNNNNQYRIEKIESKNDNIYELYNDLQKQLKYPQYKKDAEDCLKIYNKLKELINDHKILKCQWKILCERLDLNINYYTKYLVTIYKPNSIGHIFLKRIS